MALKQLMLTRKIQQRKEALEAMETRAAELKTRSEELEKAIEEAATEEEIAVVEEEIGKHDTDKEALEADKTKLEGEISALEGELEQLNSKEPSNTGSPENIPAAPATPDQRNQFTGGETRMIGFFRNMPFEQRSALVARNEVKDFLAQVRELGKTAQQRAVTGADLTIPEVMLGLIRDNLHRYSKLLPKIQLRPLKGTARQNIAGAIPEAIWTEACATLNELSIGFNQIEVDGYKVGGFIPICNATLEDSDLNLAAEILDAIAQAIGLAVDKAILYGTGKKMPLGIATRLAQSSQPSDWSSKAPAWTDLRATHLLKLNPAAMTAEAFFSALMLDLSAARANFSNGSKFWAMNTQTHAQLMARMVVFNAAGALVASMNNTMPLVGGDIEILDFIPDGDIIGGYGSLYLLAERAGIQLAQSEHVRFIEDQTVFKGTARYDGRPVFGEGFVIVNINNVDPTTVVPFAPDNANPSDAYLDELTIGNLTLTPAFNPAVTNYTAATTSATNTINVDAAKDKAVIEIKNGSTTVANGGSATWAAGVNTVTVKVTNGTTVRNYSVAVTKS
ncbi:phage major capsid protein, HK97 family [Paenibacillus sp. UNCCL117]|uniref:phage major capsid protein n=1 Tax=unclassified Paenibacillus TaxID=185978 RepID=UPI000888F5B6|nr:MULTISPECIES: phage major capsid protein [unclassified Paenibacillus]SDC69802.1 phage major capsid protein, HK97 family [Paenibacillus sp. cl123]SFW24035.1 phage major capsid protein, HK97 family [Paenibacillus sp. UNCCL117]